MTQAVRAIPPMLSAPCLALLLLGCGTLPAAARPVASHDVRAALDAWTASGKPEGYCGRYVDRVHVVTADDTGPLCWRDWSPNGCQTSRVVGLLGMGGTHVVLVERTDVSGPAIRAHELAHWFVTCSEMARDNDPAHKLPGVWAPDGVEVRIQETLR